MKRVFCGLLLGVACLDPDLKAATFYVDAANLSPVSPFGSWSTAATNLQDAVSAASAGDEVIVTNGLYQAGAGVVYGMSNRVAITKPLLVHSVNGPEVTIIQGAGQRDASAVRCAYLTNGATLSGFTLKDGNTQGFDAGPAYRLSGGGGAWGESMGALATNCVISNNTAATEGGGAYSLTLDSCQLLNNASDWYGGGASGSKLGNCLLIGNFSGHGGGFAHGSLANCVVGNNHANDGGGTYAASATDSLIVSNFAGGNGGGAGQSSALTNCTLAWNGGVYGGGAYSSILYNCIVSNNSAAPTGGGGMNCAFYNCIVTGNSVDGFDARGGGGFTSSFYRSTVAGNMARGFWAWGGGIWGGLAADCVIKSNSAFGSLTQGNGGGAYQTALYNCTIVGNSSILHAGGVSQPTEMQNCLVYYNTAPDGANWNDGSIGTYCCTLPLLDGTANFTDEPLFVNTNAWADLRLRSNSPCINAGNNSYAPSGPDRDGNPRIVGNLVDVGAYEFQSPASVLPYYWLMAYGLPLDGSADYADTDGDHMNNSQESIAGTIPTDASSVLAMLSATGGMSAVLVKWTSVTNRKYTLQRALNLSGIPAFATVQSNITGLAGITTWTDTNSPGSVPRFYRVQVQ